MGAFMNLTAILSGVISIVFIILFMIAFYDEKMMKSKARLGDYKKSKWWTTIPAGVFGLIFVVTGFMVITEGATFIKMKPNLRNAFSSLGNSMRNMFSYRPRMPTMPYFRRPVMQAPVMQAPVMQAPVMQAPVMQAPVMQAPVMMESPMMDTSMMSPDGMM